MSQRFDLVIQLKLEARERSKGEREKEKDRPDSFGFKLEQFEAETTHHKGKYHCMAGLQQFNK